MTDTVCPHCMAESMVETKDAWGVVRQTCLDCGYTREKKRKTKDGGGMKPWKKVNEYERRAIVALMQRTAMSDREIAETVGRGLWTIFHIRKAAGIPATNKGRDEYVELQALDIRDHWQRVDPSVVSRRVG